MALIAGGLGASGLTLLIGPFSLRVRGVYFVFTQISLNYICMLLITDIP
jgi:ABC-type branched-subunit amino acid transport system permease subunit